MCIGYRFHAGVIIDTTKKIMTLKDTQIQLQCSGSIGCYRVVLAERVTVPAASEIITTGRVLEPGVKRLGLGMVEPTDKSLQNGKGIVARSLIQAGETIPLTLANFSEDIQTLYPNTSIATITKVDEVETSTHVQTKQLELPNHMRELYERASLGMAKTEKKEFLKLLREYAHIFSENKTDLGRNGIIKHSIPTADAAPIRHPCDESQYIHRKRLNARLTRCWTKILYNHQLVHGQVVSY